MALIDRCVNQLELCMIGTYQNKHGGLREGKKE